MNAIEIEEAVSSLALALFDRDEFPYSFLLAFGNKETTIKRLRSGTSNKSDVGGVLQTNNIHIAVAQTGGVTQCLKSLKGSPATAKGKVRFIVTTDGEDFEAEDLDTGETVACAYQDFPDHFGFFLPLAGISTIKQIRESSFDIRATSRLNRLYIELLKDNPEWGTAERRHEMNHLMARLIFCFFAEDTDIFSKLGIFSETVEKMSERLLLRYGQVCAWALAKAHARSGDSVAIAAYLGSSNRFETAIASFGVSYADVNDQDYVALQKAAADGRVVARDDAESSK
jgi:hypothetical protein